MLIEALVFAGGTCLGVVVGGVVSNGQCADSLRESALKRGKLGDAVEDLAKLVDSTNDSHLMSICTEILERHNL